MIAVLLTLVIFALGYFAILFVGVVVSEIFQLNTFVTINTMLAGSLLLLGIIAFIHSTGAFA